MDTKTHFGYAEVAESQKAAKVAGVFSSVAPRYDLMNDVMSLGLHRWWKAFTISVSGVRPGWRVLDIAAGSGDLALSFAHRVGATGEVYLTDINPAMLALGRDRSIDAGVLIPAVQCDAERLPFPQGYFDCISVAFGLRNMTRKENALREMWRVLRPGGRLLVLEFSSIAKPLQPLYNFYSLRILPLLGKVVANDASSYRYLAESIRMHPAQAELKTMMAQAGFDSVEFFNLSAGIVALHIGRKF